MLNCGAKRDGEDDCTPMAIFGPNVMIINERAGSGGDYLPEYFKRAGACKLIGKRTGGAGTGIDPPLVDGRWSRHGAPRQHLWSGGQI